jgi:hypothetical protein
MDGLAQVRSLARGETVHVRARRALSGIVVEPDITVPLPWGTLRAPTAAEQSLLEELSVPLGQDQAAVLETTFPLRMFVRRGDEDAPDAEWLRSVRVAHDEFGLNAELAAFTAVLASDAFAPAQGWTLIDVPIGLYPHASWPLSDRPRAVERISDSRALVIEEWGRRVGRSYHASVRVAIRRTLSALAARDDPVDSLIDAVIALENLFAGTESGELRFRISLACASLLEPRDASARDELRREIGRLYDRRSRIVHGNEPDSLESVADDRERAVTLAKIALRTLFEEHPELLARRDRGTMLAVGLARDASSA